MRTYSDLGYVRFRHCCRELLGYFGAAPFSYGIGELTLERIGDAHGHSDAPNQTFEEYIQEHDVRLSFNENFWLRGMSEPDDRGYRTFGIAAEPLLTCSMAEVQAGCDPSVEVFDAVPDYLAALEAALAAAEVYPFPDSRAP